MKRALNFFLVVFFTVGVRYAYSQGKHGQELIDSVLQELPRQKEDTNKMKMLNGVSFSYIFIDPDEGIKYGQQGLLLAKKLGWKKGIATANNSLGANYDSKGDYSQALAYYTSALKADEEISNKNGMAAVLCNIGNIYRSQGNNLSALEYYFRALNMNKETGNKKYMAIVTGNIGMIYNTQGDYNKALDYYTRALKINEQIGNTQGIVGVTCNIGVVYKDQGNYAKALEYYFNALKADEGSGDKIYMANITSNIGEAYRNQKNFAMAVEYGEKALKTFEEIGDKSGTASSLCNIGNCFLSIYEIRYNTGGTGRSKMKIYNEPAAMPYEPIGIIPQGKTVLLSEAINYLQRSIAIAEEIKEPEIIQNAYKNLAMAYRFNKDYKNALESTDHYQAIKDSVFSAENDKKIMQMSIKNEYDQQHLADSLKAIAKERIAGIELRKQRSYTVMGLTGMLVLAGFSFFIARERRKSEDERKKSDSLLLNILPDEVAHELKTTGGTVAKQYGNVTVLFTDFVNFTRASEQMRPQELIDELHTCFKAFDEITAKYKIEKIKTIGDAYLATAGLPTADPQHAVHVVQAATELCAYIAARHARLGDKTFQVRIGIHSGSVVAGVVGIKKFAYDIWGDTVNIAARMEQNSEAQKINISETTYNLVKDKFTCIYRGEIEAKNKGMMKMYFVA